MLAVVVLVVMVVVTTTVVVVASVCSTSSESRFVFAWLCLGIPECCGGGGPESVGRSFSKRGGGGDL